MRSRGAGFIGTDNIGQLLRAPQVMDLFLQAGSWPTGPGAATRASARAGTASDGNSSGWHEAMAATGCGGGCGDSGGGGEGGGGGGRGGGTGLWVCRVKNSFALESEALTSGCVAPNKTLNKYCLRTDRLHTLLKDWWVLVPGLEPTRTSDLPSQPNPIWDQSPSLTEIFTSLLHNHKHANTCTLTRT